MEESEMEEVTFSFYFIYPTIFVIKARV